MPFSTIDPTTVGKTSIPATCITPTNRPSEVVIGPYLSDRVLLQQVTKIRYDRCSPYVQYPFCKLAATPAGLPGQLSSAAFHWSRCTLPDPRDVAPLALLPGLLVTWFLGNPFVNRIGVGRPAPLLNVLSRPPLTNRLATLVHSGLMLFLVRTSLSERVIRTVGWRPLAQGVSLRVLIPAASLWTVLTF